MGAGGETREVPCGEHGAQRWALGMGGEEAQADSLPTGCGGRQGNLKSFLFASKPQHVRF